MPKERDCVVKLVDDHGVEHSVRVRAESVYEAALRGLRQLEKVGWETMADLPRRQEQVNVRRRAATFNPTYLILRRRRPQRRFFSVRNPGWSIVVGPQGCVNGRQEVNSHSEF